jgi:hypothetical protein
MINFDKDLTDEEVLEITSSALKDPVCRRSVIGELEKICQIFHERMSLVYKPRKNPGDMSADDTMYVCHGTQSEAELFQLGCEFIITKGKDKWIQQVACKEEVYDGERQLPEELINYLVGRLIKKNNKTLCLSQFPSLGSNGFQNFWIKAERVSKRKIKGIFTNFLAVQISSEEPHVPGLKINPHNNGNNVIYLNQRKLYSRDEKDEMNEMINYIYNNPEVRKIFIDTFYLKIKPISK